MSRPIKFRAWNKTIKQMLKNVNIVNGDGEIVVGNSFIYPTLECRFDTTNKEHCILMQYTGLKDKNGVEIFEGDIVTEEGGHFIGEVKIGEYTSFSSDSKDEEHFGWYAFRAEDNRQQPLLELYKVEVIGNIYENPELLGDKS